MRSGRLNFSTEGLAFDTVDPTRSMVYFENALTLSTANEAFYQKVPTQLAYPNGQISLGSVPALLPATLPHFASQETEDAIHNRLQNSIYVVCTSTDESNVAAKKRRSYYARWLLLTLLIQGVLSIAEFHHLHPTAYLQRALVASIWWLGFLPMTGLLIQVAWCLDAYKSVLFELVLMMFCCLKKSVPMMLLTACVLLSEYYAKKVHEYMSAHVFILRPSSEF